MISEKLFIGFHPSVDQKQREKNLKNADLHYRFIRDIRDLPVLPKIIKNLDYFIPWVGDLATESSGNRRQRDA